MIVYWIYFGVCISAWKVYMTWFQEGGVCVLLFDVLSKEREREKEKKCSFFFDLNIYVKS